MKKILLFLLLASCTTTQIVYRDRFIVPPNVPEPVVVPAPPEPVHRSLAGLSRAMATSLIKNSMIKNYLKQHPSAWVTIKYASLFGLYQTTCQTEGTDEPPTVPFEHDVIYRHIKEPTYIQRHCTAFVGIRSLLEYNLIEGGIPRVVAGSVNTRKMLSIERHFQMKHASTKTTHPPGHVAGSSLMVILSVNSKKSGFYRVYVNGKKGVGWDIAPNTFIHRSYVKAEVLRVGNDEVLYSHIFVLGKGNFRPERTFN